MAIEIKNITKKYGSKTVVDNVSLSIDKGQLVSFIGPNGAGKSTVLGIMSRLFGADEGQVFLEQQEINAVASREIAQKLSILKQSNHVELKLTIKELVAFGRFPYSQGNLTEKDKLIIDEAICFMDLQDMQDAYLDELSGGQRQRAYIAMVLAQDTEYILLDEPLNNLDMQHSVQIMKVLHRLAHEKNKAVVIVIHDINFASVYSDYIYALKDGVLFKEGTPELIMQECELEDIFGFNIPVHQIENVRLGLYFLSENER